MNRVNSVGNTYRSLQRRTAKGWCVEAVGLYAPRHEVASVAYRLAATSDGTRPGYVTSSLSADGLTVSRLPDADTPVADGDEIAAVEGVRLEDWLLADRRIVSETLGYEIRRVARRSSIPRISRRLRLSSSEV